MQELDECIDIKHQNAGQGQAGLQGLQNKPQTPAIRTTESLIAPKKTFSSYIYSQRSDQIFKMNHLRTSRKRQNYESEHQIQDILKRAKSSKSFQDFHQLNTIETSESRPANSLNENIMKLRIEELTFKIKLKLGTLLKEINISACDLSKFTSLVSIEQIIFFLQEKVKEKLKISEDKEQNNNKIRQKEKIQFNDAENQMESLKRKLTEKEQNQKILKNKIKQTHAQLRQLYDTIHKKDKELSVQATQAYQIKVSLKENEKIIESLKEKVILLQKDKVEMKLIIDNQIKKSKKGVRQLQEEFNQLQQTNLTLKEEIQCQKQKSAKVIQLNNHLNEQVARWKDRFQWIEKQRSEEKINSKKKNIVNQSESSVSNEKYAKLQEDNLMLRAAIVELQRINSKLEKQILGYKSILQKQLKIKEPSSTTKYESLQLMLLKQKSSDLYKNELEQIFKKKTQKIAKQWKDKMLDFVTQYEDEKEILKQQIAKIEAQRQELLKKVHLLANEKYDVQNRLINRQRQLLDLGKVKKNKESFSQTHSHPKRAKPPSEGTSQESIPKTPQ